MESKEFLDFYNKVVNEKSTIESLINQYVQFISEQYNHVLFAFAALLESGSYHIIKTTSIKDTLPLHFPLYTNDINKDLYNLEPIQLKSALNSSLLFNHESFPFLTSKHVKKIHQHFNISNTLDSQLIQFNIFSKDYLVAQLCFMIDGHFYDINTIQAQLLFMRNSLQCSIEPLINTNYILKTDYILNMTEQIISTKSSVTSDPSLFMTRLLDLAMDVLDEADYGSALLYNKHYWNYVHAIGHDANALSKIELPDDIYFQNEKLWGNYQKIAPNIFLIDNIVDAKINAFKDLNETMESIKKASKPIKQTIQLRIEFNNNSKGIISLDIKKDSPYTFTNKTTIILKQLHLLGKILFNYTSLNTYSKSFEDLTNLISTFISSSKEENTDFLHNFLKLLTDNIFEADYASAFLRDSKGVYYLASIGHNIDKLKEIDFKPEYFISTPNSKQQANENQQFHIISANVFDNIYEHARLNMPVDIHKSYLKAALPIKSALISQTHLYNDLYMNIAIDIKQDSPLSFTDESIKSFEMLNNLGFAFISNNYFIDKYKTLNEQLESTIKDRTKALELTNTKLQEMVLKDSLTNLYNHKAIINQLNEFILNDISLSIFLFDIDNFKRVNDLYGHQKGDDVLLGISELLMEYKHIISGRYGGEEFLLLLPGLNLEEAVLFSEHIRLRIETSEFIKEQTITVSGGVATNKKGSAIKLIKTADTLLYLAKENGRNQIASDYCE